MRSFVARSICVVVLFSAGGAFAATTTTAFTYQGQLKDNGVPLTDTRDLKFALFDAATAGNAVGTAITKSGIALSNGLFTVELDFGAVFDGSDRFLEISHGPAGGTLTVLSPRQKLTATPYAAHAGGIDGIRIVPAAAPASDAPGIIGGFSANTITNGVKGGTIGGGGNTADGPNKVTDDYGTVAGGRFNTAGFNAVVGGGLDNFATGNQATVAGGDNNVASGLFSTVPGGQSNNASGANSFAAGTFAKAGNSGSFVWGDNSGSQTDSTADNDFTARAIGGFRFLTDTTDTSGISISNAANTNVLSAIGSIPLVLNVGGARALQVTPTAANEAPSIAFGYINNTITSGVNGGTIGGGGNNGSQNIVTDDYGTVSGGRGNQAGDGAGTTSDQQYATVSGGFANTASGTYAAIPGGFFNVASGRSSFAGGRKAKAIHDGSFVFGDSSDFNVNSIGPDSFTVRSVGGAEFISAIDGTGNPTAAAFLPSGGTSFAAPSDRNKKKNFRTLEGEDVLNKIAAMPVTKWNYKWESDSDVPHIGPMAQDFKGAFYPGRDDKYITTLEFDGVELAAIKALEARSRSKDAEIKALKTENEDMKTRLEKLEKLVEQLAKK